MRLHTRVSTFLFATLLIVCITIAAALTGGSSVQAQAGQTTTAIYDAYTFEAVTVSTTSVGLTSSLVLPSNGIAARHAYCTVEDAEIRIRYDGTDPTTTVGHVFATGTSFSIYGSNNIRRLRAIRTTGSDGELQCTLAR